MNHNDQRHRLTYIVRSEEEGLLREFLTKHKQISKRSLAKIKYTGELLVNGEPVTVRACLKAGDRVDVVFPLETESDYLMPEKMELHIVYEDDDVLLINKPAGIAVHPTFNYTRGTIANGVMYHWQLKGWQRTFHPVNRLDKDTSGLILIAQSRFAHQQLSLQQKEHLIERRYYAFVHGAIDRDEGTIEAPIGRATDSIIKRAVIEDGKYAKTFYKVKKRTSQYTWLDVRLATGRTHQIRVHFSSIGHPLIGDDLYGGTRELCSRQALHAYYTSFKHPQSKRLIEVTADMPAELKALI